MPYTSNADLPAGVKDNLPKHAQGSFERHSTVPGSSTRILKPRVGHRAKRRTRWPGLP
jgi:hypothetical protein